MTQAADKNPTGSKQPTEWVEGGTLWLRPAPNESVADFTKRVARARGPLTDTEKVRLRDIFAPVLDRLADDTATAGSAPA